MNLLKATVNNENDDDKQHHAPTKIMLFHVQLDLMESILSGSLQMTHDLQILDLDLRTCLEKL